MSSNFYSSSMNPKTSYLIGNNEYFYFDTWSTFCRWYFDTFRFLNEVKRFPLPWVDSCVYLIEARRRFFYGNFPVVCFPSLMTSSFFISTKKKNSNCFGRFFHLRKQLSVTRKEERKKTWMTISVSGEMISTPFLMPVDFYVLWVHRSWTVESLFTP